MTCVAFFHSDCETCRTSSTGSGPLSSSTPASSTSSSPLCSRSGSSLSSKPVNTVEFSFQYWLMRDLEKMAGAQRIGIIYLGSGMVGNLASAIFVPYRAEVGPAGAHFGLLATSIVEVIHQWPSLKYPEMAILKLVGVTAVFFLAGLLPWIDNYAHLFGFIFGFLISYAIMPFVTFGIYDRRRKLILLWICLVSSMFIFVGLILLFYVTPIHDCEICKYFNCIPITKDFCSEQNIDLREAV